MNIQTVAEKVKGIFGVERAAHLGAKLEECCINNDTEKLEQYVNMVDDLAEDDMQKIYEYYCANTTKELNQFYTPRSVSELLAKMVDKENVERFYDCCCGSGSLTICMHNKYPDAEFYAQELDDTVIPYMIFNACIRNMHGYIINGDVLKDEYYKVYKLTSGDKFSTVEEVQNVASFKMPEFDAIVSNPPYSCKFENAKEDDPRFSSCGTLPPKSKFDWGFYLDNVYRLKTGGVSACIMFPGILYRGNAEQKIRKYLENEHLIDCIVQLPSNMFTFTQISTSVIIGTKDGNEKRITFFDAQEIGTKSGKVVELRNDDVNKIFELCKGTENAAGLVTHASHEEIEKADYNMSVSTFVEKKLEKEKIDIALLNEEIAEVAVKRIDMIFKMKKLEDMVGGPDSLGCITFENKLRECLNRNGFKL